MKPNPIESLDEILRRADASDLPAQAGHVARKANILASLGAKPAVAVRVSSGASISAGVMASARMLWFAVAVAALGGLGYLGLEVMEPDSAIPNKPSQGSEVRLPENHNPLRFARQRLVPRSRPQTGQPIRNRVGAESGSPQKTIQSRSPSASKLRVKQEARLLSLIRDQLRKGEATEANENLRKYFERFSRPVLRAEANQLRAQLIRKPLPPK